MENSLFVLSLVSLTSAVSYTIGVKRLGLSGSRVQKAAGKMVECVGMTLVFVVVNLAAGLIAVTVAGVVTGRYVSPYLISEQMEVFLVFSALQGLLFQWWQEVSGQRPPPKPQ